MTQQPVMVHLPDDLYNRIRRVAEERNRSVETVLLDGLTLLFGDLSGDLEMLMPALETFSEEQLWAIVHRRLTWAEDARLRELLAASKQARLSGDEQAELDSLLAQVDRFVILRSKALLLLAQKGQDVASYLPVGA
jgi:hypothetical protein